jgi:hypothetical protein
MSGTQSALIGGGGVPVGAHIPMPGAPAWYRANGREYLRAGALLPYSASYAASIDDFPGLRVFGNDAKSYTPEAGGGGYTAKYYRIGTNYVCVLSGSSSASYNAALSGSWTSCTTPQNVPSGVYKFSAANGTGHLAENHRMAWCLFCDCLGNITREQNGKEMLKKIALFKAHVP